MSCVQKSKIVLQLCCWNYQQGLGLVTHLDSIVDRDCQLSPQSLPWLLLDEGIAAIDRTTQDTKLTTGTAWQLGTK